MFFQFPISRIRIGRKVGRNGITACFKVVEIERFIIAEFESDLIQNLKRGRRTRETRIVRGKVLRGFFITNLRIY